MWLPAFHSAALNQVDTAYLLKKKRGQTGIILKVDEAFPERIQRK
jgi:hypothetical protein